MNDAPISVLGVIFDFPLHCYYELLKTIRLSERLVQVHGVGISRCSISKERVRPTDVVIIFIPYRQRSVHDFNQPCDGLDRTS
jgi:hypothetical protein